MQNKMPTVDPRIEIMQMADALDHMIIARSESGAFRGANEPIRQELINLIHRARNELGDNPAESKACIVTAQSMLADVVRTQSFAWRLIHIWALIPFVYFSLLITAFIWASIWQWHYIEQTDFLGIPLVMLCYSFIGGICRSLWWLGYRVSWRQYRHHHTLPDLAGPWLAVFLGVFVYFALLGGLLVLEGGDSTPNEKVVPVFMFLAGYSWEWVASLIEKMKGGSASQNTPKQENN